MDVTTLMRATIEEAKKSIFEDEGVHPKVGALIVSADGTILQKSHRGEKAGSHAEYLCLEKAREADMDLEGCVLFTTLEPCTARGPGKKACCTHIIESKIKTIYIGMLDPDPEICGKGETRLRFHIDVERFPSNLVKEISSLMSDFVDKHKGVHLSEKSLYVTKQIHKIMGELLTRKGIPLSDDLPINENLTTEDIRAVCESVAISAGIENLDIEKLVQEARSEAFDNKYVDRTYDDDGRGQGEYWKDSVRRILGDIDLQDKPMVVVGIGNGLEGEDLYRECKQLIAVDIAEKSLQETKKRLPKSRIVKNSAEDLNRIATNSQDIYISLRTYQSTYFDRNSALREAYRVMRPEGKLIISIANGFLVDGRVIQGLVKPGTSVVDQDLGFHIADEVRRQMSVLGFKDIGVVTNLDEIHVYGTRGK